MRSHEIGPVVVELRQTAHTVDGREYAFVVRDENGVMLARGTECCGLEQDPEGLQAAYEILLWLTTEDEVGTMEDPEWRALCIARHRSIVDEELWEELENEIAAVALEFSIAAMDVEDGLDEEGGS